MRKAPVVLGSLVIVATIAVIAGAASLGSRSGRGTAPGSSFRADESGLLGARRLLGELGFTVESRRGAKLPEGKGHLLIRVDGLPHGKSVSGAIRRGSEAMPDDEALAAGRELAAWVARGNAVLLTGAETPRGTDWPAIESRGGEKLAPSVEEDEDDYDEEFDRADAKEALALLFGDDRPVVSEFDGVDVQETVSLPGPGDPWVSERWRVVVSEGVTALAASEEDVVVAEVARGAGRVVLVADPCFLSNVRLANSDNAAWLAVLATRLTVGGSVWFDDRAVGQSASRGVMSLFAEAGFGPALAAGAMLLLLFWWRVGPSDAPDRFVREATAYRPESFALLRADLYAGCLTSEEARRIVRDEVARRLSRSDATGCDRALTNLAARDPARAARIREALAALPESERDAPKRRPDAWCAAVGRVGRAIEEPARETR